ncbi:hypothetical protein DNTS_023853 [Danionella cerebrum]|uniref:Uncharacterized protein n=1 Tax=Danionella cerebrum TaxID=2873325 RepID=A0A553QSZ3_9TELE|nr:hypothetical protein DNTS_023853 [Danionella translucida]
MCFYFNTNLKTLREALEEEIGGNRPASIQSSSDGQNWRVTQFLYLLWITLRMKQLVIYDLQQNSTDIQSQNHWDYYGRIEGSPTASKLNHLPAPEAQEHRCNENQYHPPKQKHEKTLQKRARAETRAMISIRFHKKNTAVPVQGFLSRNTRMLWWYIDITLAIEAAEEKTHHQRELRSTLRKGLKQTKHLKIIAQIPSCRTWKGFIKFITLFSTSVSSASRDSEYQIQLNTCNNTEEPSRMKIINPISGGLGSGKFGGRGLQKKQ